MTGPSQEPHALLAACCFFAVLLLALVDAVVHLLGGTL